MSGKTKKLLGAAVFAAVLAGGVGVAAAGGPGPLSALDDDPALTGDDLQRATEAALAAVGGGTVASTEVENEAGDAPYEVEVTRDDGTHAEVELDASFAVVGVPEVDGPGDDDWDDD